MLGQADINLRVGSQVYELNVWVTDKMPQFLLGYDWLSRPSVRYFVGERFLLARQEKVKVHVRSVGNNSRRIFSVDTVEIPPDSWREIRVRCPYGNDTNRANSANWMVDAGVLPPHSVSARVTLSVLDGTQGVLVTNVGNDPLVILKDTPLGVAEKVEVVSASLSTSDTQLSQDSTAKQPTESKPTVELKPSEGKARSLNQKLSRADVRVDLDSDHYDSDEPNEWESEIDQLSSLSIEELLSQRPTDVTSSRLANANPQLADANLQSPGADSHSADVE
jgi:hypothetical protein